VRVDGEFAKGYFCEPTFVTNLPFEHRLWQHEMFLPITTIGKVSSLDQAMEIATSVNYGLTSGFYGAESEIDWFYDRIQAGVNYVNRPQGATTGAWPGFQPFGGWKGSGSSGKNGGGHYYVPLYMHEQIRTLVK
jgi:1-pyrroline-5-carboxylate dehydrogenase